MKTWNTQHARAEQLLSDPINADIVDIVKYYSEAEGMKEKIKEHNQKLSKYKALHWFRKFFMTKPYLRDYMDIDELFSRMPLSERSTIDRIKLLEAAKLLKSRCYENDFGDRHLIGVTTSGCKTHLAAGRMMIIDTTQTKIQKENVDTVPLYLYTIRGSRVLRDKPPPPVNEGNITPHEAIILAEALLKRAQKALSERGESDDE